jgi:hypothetical protein
MSSKRPRTIFLVELFSGSSSVAKAIARSLPAGARLRVHSVDIHPEYNPTTATDLMKWDYRTALQAFLADAKPDDLVWLHASPPCTEFSRAKTTAPRNLPLADGLVRRTLRILKHVGRLAPDADRFFWTVENPVGLLRTRPYMQRLEPCRHTTSYCKWGKNYRKDTDIWTNVPGLELPLCRRGSYCADKALHGQHLVSAQSGPTHGGTPGSVTGENVYPLPHRLTSHIFRQALRGLI